MPGIIGLLLLCSLLLIGCDQEEEPRSESTAEATEEETTSPPPPNTLAAAEKPPPLSAPRQLQFRTSDFQDANEKRILSLNLIKRATRLHRPDDLEERLFEFLRARVPAPYELRWRQNIQRGEQVWGRVSVTYRKRVDRYKKRSKSKPRRGKLRFDFYIQTRFPGDHVSNWDDLHHRAVYERKYEEILNIEEELWSSLEMEVPSLAVRLPDEATDFERRLDMRQGMAEEMPNPVFRAPVLDVYRGGCAAILTNRGVELYRLHDTSDAVLILPDANNLAARCTNVGVFLAEAETDRAVKVWFEPWDGFEAQPWANRASFAKPIDVKTLRFMASGDILCLVGEQTRVGERYSRIQCYEAATGKAVWERTEPGTDIEAIAIRQGVVVVAAGRHLRLLNVDTGEELWSREVEDATGLSEQSGSCLVDDLFVFAHGIGKYMSFNVQQREAVWDLTTFGGGFLYCDGAGGIYLDEVGGTLLSLSSDNMTPRWRFHVASPIRDAIFHGGYLFVLLRQAVYAIESETGEIAWTLGVDAEARELFRHDRRLYLVGQNRLYELTEPSRL